MELFFFDIQSIRTSSRKDGEENEEKKNTINVVLIRNYNNNEEVTCKMDRYLGTFSTTIISSVHRGRLHTYV